jgi:transcriptional regulator with XRE-family HTH domain
MKPTTKPTRTAQQRAEEEAIRRQHTAKPIRQLPSSAISQQSFTAILRLVARFKTLRERQGLTLAEVASRMGIDAPALSRLETGKMLNPTLATLYKWAEALDWKCGVDLYGAEKTPSPNQGRKLTMDAETALKSLEVLWGNFRRLAEQVDLEVMSADRRNQLEDQNPPLGPFLRAAWFARQGFIISAWSLWEYFSRMLCEGQPSLVAKKPRESCVEWVAKSFTANQIPFPRHDWFSSANALRNLIAHYGGRVTEPGALRYFEKAKKVADFHNLELFRDAHVNIQVEHVSAFQWEIGEFFRDLAPRTCRN